jgi:hypothetical protein
METVLLVNLFVFVIVSGIGTFVGLDLKKWSSWLYGLYGFLTGFSTYFLRPDVVGSLQLGTIFAFLVMYAGAMNRWHRQRYEKIAESWLSQHEQDKRFSLLTRLIKTILHK